MSVGVASPSEHRATGTVPYVGPRPFTFEDARDGVELYGRERDVEHLVDLLISKRIVLLHSPSGAGKTSLIQAKLITTLDAENFHVLPVVRVGPEPHIEGMSLADLRGANRYVLSTLQCLELALPEEQRAHGRDLLGQTLPEWFDRHFENDATRFPFLIFDQFEEVLTADPTDRDAKLAFFDQLGTTLRNRGRWALFAMREDFVAALDPYVQEVPTRLADRYRLDLLDDAGALEAITRPAEKAGVPFTESAARELVDELRLTQVQRPDGSTDTVKGLYVEPVQLQVVCYTLWQRLPAEIAQITSEHVRQFGDVNQALSAFYERTLATTARMTHVSIGRLRRWFESELVTSGGTRGLVYRGAQLTAGLPNTAVDALEGQHLIRAEARAGARWYELTHDRFVQPIKASNAAWERRRAKTWLSAAVAVAVLVALIAIPVVLSQRVSLATEVQSAVLSGVAAGQATAFTAATDVAAGQESVFATLEQARATDTAVARATSFAISEATGVAQATSTPRPERSPTAGGLSTVTPVVVAGTPPARVTVTPPALVTGTPPVVVAGTPPVRVTSTPSARATSTPPPVRPTAAPAAQPTPTEVPPLPAAAPPTWIRIGASVDNQDIRALQVGNGRQHVGLIGALHGGEEAAAYKLLADAADRLERGELTVPPEITLFLVPTLNPDDLTARTGFNKHDVDLNRNFPAGWIAKTCGSANGRYRKFGGCSATGGGTAALSEPESLAASKLINDQHLNTVFILDSGLNAVSSRNGGSGIGQPLALDISQQFKIPYARSCCANYPVSGQLVDWVESMGLRGVEISTLDRLLDPRGGIDLLTFALERAAARTCTPTLQTGEFALRDAPGDTSTYLAIVSPGEAATVKRRAVAPGEPASADPWLEVVVTQPNDGRQGWMFTRETNGARPFCSFDLSDPSGFS